MRTDDDKKQQIKRDLSSDVKPQISKDELIFQLINAPEQKVREKFSDESLDRKNKIIELLSGQTIDLEEEERKLKEIIANVTKEYAPRVPQEYYRQIFRLQGWVIPEGKISTKPSIVGRFTNEIIYSRYTKNILPTLQIHNPYIRIGLRRFKHHQWLTEQGLLLFDTYIQDAVEVMKECTNWYEFRIKHAAKFGVTFQLDLFKKK